MKRILKIILIIVAIFFIYALFINIQAEKDHINPYGNKDFVVEEGQSVGIIAENLYSEGFIDSQFTFKIYLLLSGQKSKLLPGEYHLHTEMSMKEIVTELVKVERVKDQIKITLLEGWNIEEIAAYLSEIELVKEKDFITYATMKDFDYDFLDDKPAKASLEGFLYPDTYYVYEDASAEEVIIRLLNNFDQRLSDEIRQEIKKKDLDIFEVVTIASIIEKEVFGYENRLKVANIIEKRLDAGMALQMDSTVNYITKSGRASSTVEDLQIDDPYNTYKYPGLPPGPIANPSIESIKAVVYAETNPYWFFLTDADGKVHFAKTHDEHVDNKFKYLK